MALAIVLVATLSAGGGLQAAPVLVNDPIAPRVRQVAVAPAGDYWLEVEHRAAIVSIDHYGSDGALRSREFIPAADEWERGVSVPELRPQADGSVLGFGLFCDLWKIAADGHLLWRSNSLYPNTNCAYIARALSGAVWQAELQPASGQMSLRRRDAVGRDLGPVPLQPLRAITSNPIAVPGSESVWVGTSTEVDGESLPSVAEVRTDGSITRRWVAPVDLRGLPIQNLTATADGGWAATTTALAMLWDLAFYTHATRSIELATAQVLLGEGQS